MTIVSTLVAGWLCQICTTLALVGCAYALAATALTQRFARRVDTARSDFSSVTILKPLCGLEIDLRENLASFCRQDYRGPLQIIFGVQRSADPAASLFHELRSEFPELNMRLVIDDHQHGANRKVSNLINMARFVEHDVLVLADSESGTNLTQPSGNERANNCREQPRSNIGRLLGMRRFSMKWVRRGKTTPSRD